MSSSSMEIRLQDIEASQQPETKTQFQQAEQDLSGSRFQQADIEASKPWTDTELLSGFPQTAHFLAADPDKSTVIFRRFDKVSIRNLLYLEGRIAALETLQDDLDREDKNDHKGDDDVAAAAASWEDFAVLGSGKEFPSIAYNKWARKREDRIKLLEQNRAKRSQSQSNPKSLASTHPGLSKLVEHRWQVAGAINIAVKEYQEALLLYSQLLNLKAPAERSRQTVADWFKGVYTDPKTKMKQKIRKTSQFYQDSAMFDVFENGVKTGEHSKRMPSDMVSLHSPADDDFISQKIANWRLTFRLLKNKDMSDSEIIYVPEKRIHKSVTLIELVAAVAYLVVAIWTLYVVKPYKVKLGVLTAFVILFGIWVSLATPATKSEIFAATAAYAAVLVVYVGK